ncbi:hypothetical protein HMPREF0058_1902, partial [Actinomyces urogenitalis DSM 15434]
GRLAAVLLLAARTQLVDARTALLTPRTASVSHAADSTCEYLAHQAAARPSRACPLSTPPGSRTTVVAAPHAPLPGSVREDGSSRRRRQWR